MSQLPRIARPRSTKLWNFDFNPKQKRWEAFKLPIDWPTGLYQWLIDTYGNPSETGEWDMLGGWLYFKNQDSVTLFLLKWQ